MFELMENIMGETPELPEGETMEQEMNRAAVENGEPEENSEAVGYSSEALQSAWSEYERLDDREKEKFLRGHSRNAHIMNVELSRQKRESSAGSAETAETGEDPEAVGYSSSYYEHQMASALKNGNRIAYDNAKSNWAKAKVKESVGAATGEGDAPSEAAEFEEFYNSKVRKAWDHYNSLPQSRREEFLKEGSQMAGIVKLELQRMEQGKSVSQFFGETGEPAETDEGNEAMGYSSSYYEHQMASALKNGNRIAYDNAKSNWAKAKVRESVGSASEEGEAAAETEEAMGSSAKFWLNRATKDLAEGHITAHKINMGRYYDALKKE